MTPNGDAELGIATPLPWHRPQLEQLLMRFADGRAPHALLIAGPPGSGKTRYAQALAAALGCEAAPGAAPCGACRGCRRFAAASPDHRLVAPEPDKRQILVEAIRELEQFFALTAHSAPVQTAVIAPAEAMHRSAANALLKTLEEPAGRSLLLLVSHAPGQVPATIRSRCERMLLAQPARPQALAWLAREAGCSAPDAQRYLALASGRVLQALAIAGEGDAARQAIVDGLQGLCEGRLGAAAVAARWDKAGIDATLHWLPTLMLDATRQHLAPGAALTHADAAGLQQLADRLLFDAWNRAIEQVNELRRLRSAGSAFNSLLALEALAGLLKSAVRGKSQP